MRYLLAAILIFSINLKAESPFSEKPEAGEFLEALKYILGSNQNEENNPLNFYEREGLLYKKFTDTPYTGSFEGIVQGQVLKGKKVGEWKMYYFTGELKETAFWDNNQRTGTWISYYKSGELKSKRFYKNNKRIGKIIHYNKDGSIKKKKVDKKLDKKKTGSVKTDNALRDKYIKSIASKIRNNWVYQGAKDEWGCDVYILQDKKGEVQSVNIQSCSVDNRSKLRSFKNSIERAVYKASPLPAANSNETFSRELLLKFRVN